MEGSDRKPCCGFWLRSKEQFKTEEEINESVKRLIENLLYWSDPKFNDYFKCRGDRKTFKLDLDIEDSFLLDLIKYLWSKLKSKTTVRNNLKALYMKQL